MSSFWDGFMKQAERGDAAKATGAAGGAALVGAAAGHTVGSRETKRIKELKDIARTSGHHAEHATHKMLRPGFAAAAQEATHGAATMAKRNKRIGGAVGTLAGIGAGLAGWKAMKGHEAAS